ncbi:hypothetical protein I7I48_02770 [Histoplasma ohiense]|nr:hypothetical protein I7I48_02770 [Histoplasma ohiense (nom. inval.)]
MVEIIKARKCYGRAIARSEQRQGDCSQGAEAGRKQGDCSQGAAAGRLRVVSSGRVIARREQRQCDCS